MKIINSNLASPVRIWSGQTLASLADQGLGISLILLLFSLPFAYITAVREIALGLAAFFWVMAMVLNRRLSFQKTPLDWPLLAWVGVALLSLLWAVNPAYSFKEIKGEILKGLLIFYLVCYGLNREDRLKQVFLSLIVSNLLMVFWGFWFFYAEGGRLNEFTVRASSLHSGYGSLGTYLITVFPFLLIGCFSPLLKKFRWALWGLVGVNLFCIYITFGRAMWLAVALEIAVLGLVLLRKRVVLILSLVLLVLFLLIPKTVWFHNERLPSGPGISSQTIGGTGGDLIDVWKLSFSFLQDRPFQGIGFGRNSFSETFKDFRAQHQPLLWHAHNTFLNIFFQTGLQGLVVFLWLVMTTLYCLYQRSKEGILSWPGMFALAAAIMVLGFFSRNLFDDFYVDDNALLFWYLIGAGLSGVSRLNLPIDKRRNE
jgi:O-antigen ligase